MLLVVLLLDVFVVVLSLGLKLGIFAAEPLPWRPIRFAIFINQKSGPLFG
jgi:hypothetical protein